MVRWIAVSLLLCFGCLQICQSNGPRGSRFVMSRSQRGLSLRKGRSLEGKKLARSKKFNRGGKCRKGRRRGGSGTRKRKGKLQNRKRKGRSRGQRRKVRCRKDDKMKGRAWAPGRFDFSRRKQLFPRIL